MIIKSTYLLVTESSDLIIDIRVAVLPAVARHACISICSHVLSLARSHELPPQFLTIDSVDSAPVFDQFSVSTYTRDNVNNPTQQLVYGGLSVAASINIIRVPKYRLYPVALIFNDFNYFIGDVCFVHDLGWFLLQLSTNSRIGVFIWHTPLPYL